MNEENDKKWIWGIVGLVLVVLFVFFLLSRPAIVSDPTSPTPPSEGGPNNLPPNYQPPEAGKDKG